MGNTRKRYSADFKAKVALEVLKGDLTLAQLAAKHGVHQTMISTWRKQAADSDVVRPWIPMSVRPVIPK
jgi:transposase